MGRRGRLRAGRETATDRPDGHAAPLVGTPKGVRDVTATVKAVNAPVRHRGPSGPTCDIPLTLTRRAWVNKPPNSSVHQAVALITGRCLTASFQLQSLHGHAPLVAKGSPQCA